jgi:hypothetical protein
MLVRIDDDEGFLQSVLFSDEATFHVSGLLNRYNVRIWGSENPHESREFERDSPNFKVLCGLMRNRIIGPFFFIENTIAANVYLDMLNFAEPQLEDLQPHVIFQQDGAPPPPLLGSVCSWLSEWTLSWSVDWKGWPDSLATSFARHNPSGLLFMGLC